MCVLLGADVIIASTVKRIDNFYSAVMKLKDMNRQTLAKQVLYKGYRFSIKDCLDRQQEARYSALGVVIADARYEEFEHFLDNQVVFERCGEDCFKLTKAAEDKCLNNQVNSVIDDILQNAYSQKTLLALDIL